MNFNPTDHLIMFAKPEWMTKMTAWQGHVPFAMFLISALKPRTFVELGVMRGDSYCAFCQSVKALGGNTNCYGIDSWVGDEHAGHYQPDEILPVLREHHDVRYGHFSTLVQATFDEVLPQFSDGSIDLLHIDGLHTYDAVKHDFETWLPKMSRQGVILFHDTNVRERHFGVYKLWEELSVRYPHFEFLHSYGLGVLGVGDAPPAALAPFFQANAHETQVLRAFFDLVGTRTTEEAQRLRYVQWEHAEAFRDLGEKKHQLQEQQTVLQAAQSQIRSLEQENMRLVEELSQARTAVAAKDHRLQELATVQRTLQTQAQAFEQECQRVMAETGALRAVLDDYAQSRVIKLVHKLWRIRSAYSSRI